MIVPTHTGIGERAHLAHPGITLATHVADLFGVVECEELADFVLLGHSYGGMVATALADRIPDRLRGLVYLDAFVPRDGQALFDLIPAEAREALRAAAVAHGEGWRIPPNPLPEDTPRADLDWALPKRVMQPLGAFSEAVRLSGAIERVPRSYIYCTRPAHGDGFAKFAEHARTEPGWRYREIDSSHSPQITAPDALAALLDELGQR
jgi:pimeloyl-ACP methyl ester carboxylesterase